MEGDAEMLVEQREREKKGKAKRERCPRRPS
jgi:hypothetical protein